MPKKAHPNEAGGAYISLANVGKLSRFRGIRRVTLTPEQSRWLRDRAEVEEDRPFWSNVKAREVVRQVHRGNGFVYILTDRPELHRT